MNEFQQVDNKKLRKKKTKSGLNIVYKWFRSCLNVVPEPTPEMLRAQEEDDAAIEDQVSDKLDIVIRRKFGRRPSFKEIVEHEEMLAKNLGYSPKKMKTMKENFQKIFIVSLQL